jgi:hypothetical protein
MAKDEAVGAARGALSNGQLGAVIAVAVAGYAALQAVGGGLPDSVKIGVPFLVLPLAAARLWGRPWQLGAIDRTLAFSAAAYAPFAVAVALSARGAAWYFAPLAATVTAAPLAGLWALDTFIHVGAVDYFTKAIVQREAEPRFGRWNAFALQVVAWSAGHIVEWFWLRLLFGGPAAALYLVSAGAVTGLAFMKWRNVLGLMVGHFCVNVAAAAAAVSLYG